MYSPAQIRILPLMLTFAITVGGPAAAAESSEWDEPARPRNYSVPRDNIKLKQDSAEEAAPVPARHDTGKLPDLGAETVGNAGHRIHMPYGSGYEARQRSGAFGGGMGGSRGVGSGRSMGRRR